MGTGNSPSRNCSHFCDFYRALSAALVRASHHRGVFFKDSFGGCGSYWRHYCDFYRALAARWGRVSHHRGLFPKAPRAVVAPSAVTTVTFTGLLLLARFEHLITGALFFFSEGSSGG